jgi:hypothetical protein
VSDSFEITYAAHTATCTFLLDGEGVCRRIVIAPSSNRSLHKARDAARAAARCVGAQYVASLDATVSGMLAEKPRVGGAMLFARVDERGRVSLVRSGVVTRFEIHRAEDPFVETEKAPSMSVQTSAPVIAPSAPTPRRVRESAPPPQEIDVYEEDATDRTQPIQAMRPQDFRNLTARGAPSLRPPGLPKREAPASSHPRAIALDEDVTLDRTAEYTSEGAARRTTWPSPGVALDPGPLPTLRQPPAIVPASEEDHDPYTRGILPRRSEPQVVRTRSERVPRSADPGRTPRASTQYPPITEKVAGRRRGDR